MSKQNISDIILDEHTNDYTNVYENYKVKNNITSNKMTK